MAVSNPYLLVLYDGYRNGKHMIVPLPYSHWGEKAYGLVRNEDGFAFVHPPTPGEKLRVNLDRATLQRLERQRKRREAARLKKRLLGAH